MKDAYVIFGRIPEGVCVEIGKCNIRNLEPILT